MFGVCQVYVKYGYECGGALTNRFWYNKDTKQWSKEPLQHSGFKTKKQAENFIKEKNLKSVFIYAEGDPYGEQPKEEVVSNS